MDQCGNCLFISEKADCGCVCVRYRVFLSCIWSHTCIFSEWESVRVCACDYMNVHMCVRDNLDLWQMRRMKISADSRISSKEHTDANTHKNQHSQTLWKGHRKSGLFVALPLLFFFFWSNPPNPQAVICSCSVIWGKASPSLRSYICTSSLHPALTL